MRLFAAAWLLWTAVGTAQAATAERNATIEPAPQPSDGAADMLGAAFDNHERMTAPVFVNGAGPFAFTIDTGADRTVISDDLAMSLSLPPGKGVVMHDIAGSQDVATATMARLKVGAREIDNVAAAVLTRTNLGAVGMLGIDSVADQRVVLDFKAQRIEISASPTRREPVEPDTIVVRAKRRFGQLILVDSRFRGHKVYVVVDTGAQGSIGNPALRRMVTRGTALSPVELVSVTGRRAIGDELILPEIELGNARLTDVPIAFADLHIFRRLGLDKAPAILLGMDVLRVFERVSVDFTRKKARFQLARSEARPIVATGVPATRIR